MIRKTSIRTVMRLSIQYHISYLENIHELQTANNTDLPKWNTRKSNARITKHFMKHTLHKILQESAYMHTKTHGISLRPGRRRY